ncbi:MULTISPECIES: hypothetical protein [unclassified Flavobacterium]|nr:MULTISPECIES: hypothetical protein [unclassified Flavobacterium]UMY66623.1 hypothetical protein MKO97_04350 [Flavobacterium sp. HJ-32-4]
MPFPKCSFQSQSQSQELAVGGMQLAEAMPATRLSVIPTQEGSHMVGRGQ